jgi:hypothetical protein
MARAWIELTGEQAGWGPARIRMAGLSQAGYVCEVLAGSGPLVLVLTGRKLSVSELLAIGRPPARPHDPGRFPDLGRHLPGAARHLSSGIFTVGTGAVLPAPSPVMCAVMALT